MKTWDISANASEWSVLTETPRTQAAVMTIKAGGKVGNSHHRHEDTDQWLLVLDGSGEATIDGLTLKLKAGTLLLIEAGNTHEIRASADARLRTVNFYGPPTDF